MQIFDQIKRFKFLILFIAAGTSLFLYTSRYDGPPRSITFLDRHHQWIGTLYPLNEGFQQWIPLKKIPPDIIQATIKKEDRFFYWHLGLNPIAVIKSLVDNIRQGQVVRGGSTLTQQLAKNLMQEKNGKNNSRTWTNKIKEAFLALGLEIKHSKKWILERYLNTVYYGNRCYGLGAAAQFYLGKNLEELTENEIDWITSLPKAPNKLSASLKGKTPHPIDANLARHFMEYVLKQEGKKVKKNPVIETTLDLTLQKNLESGLKQNLQNRTSEDPLLNAALIVINVPNGDILTMIGSRDYTNNSISGQFNAATALRQPGSTLKPFTYFTALSKGYSADTLIPDEPVSFSATEDEKANAYSPQNFDRHFHGFVSLKQALANSYNVPAVVALNDIGLGYYYALLKKFGFTSLNQSPDHYGLSLTLGSGEVSLVELTNAYATLARDGQFLPFRYLTDQKIPKSEEVLPQAEKYAHVITDILADSSARLKAFGWNEDLIIEDRNVSVKTGTSFEHRDNWTIGYNKKYAVGVWVGHSDSSPLNGTTGATGAGPLWHMAFENLLRKKSETEQGRNQTLEKPSANHSENNPFPLPSWQIISPLSNNHYRVSAIVPKEHQKILASIKTNGLELKNFQWYLDDISFKPENFSANSSTIKGWITPEIGKHVFTVKAEDGSTQRVVFWVEQE